MARSSKRAKAGGGKRISAKAGRTMQKVGKLIKGKRAAARKGAGGAAGGGGGGG